jgi:TRAP-type C4-dicarboxylate transport system permease small subunit
MLLRAFTRLLDATGVVVGLVLGAIAVLICLDIALRSGPDLLNWLGLARGMRPAALPFVTELCEYLMYAAAFIGAPWALRKGAHVRVDVFIAGLSPAAARALDRVIDAVGFAISVVLLVYGALAVVDAWQTNLVARKTWNYDEWLLLLPVPFAGLLLAIEFVLRFLRVGEAAAHAVDPTKKTAI